MRTSTNDLYHDTQLTNIHIDSPLFVLNECYFRFQPHVASHRPSSCFEYLLVSTGSIMIAVQVSVVCAVGGEYENVDCGATRYTDVVP